MKKMSHAPVTHTCNPSCAGGRDQENCGSRPALAVRSYLENTQHKKRLSGGSSGKSSCLGRMRPWIQTPVPQKKRNG
jgi:hypothetical protein